MMIFCRFCIESTNRRLNIWMGISKQIERLFLLFCRLVLFVCFSLFLFIFRMVFNCYLTGVRDSIVSHFGNYSQLFFFFLKTAGLITNHILFLQKFPNKKKNRRESFNDNNGFKWWDSQWISKVILYSLARLLYCRTNRE